MTITPLLLLQSMLLNSAGAAANNTGHDVPSLLALIASPGNQQQNTGPPEIASRSPSSARAWQRYQLAKLPPWLQLDETSLSRTPSSRDRSLVSRETRTSRPHAAATPPRAFFPRVATLRHAFTVFLSYTLDCAKYLKTIRMWADAQRDGRPAKYRWRPLFDAAKFG